MLYLIRQFKNLFHLLEAITANIYYGFPSRDLKIIGVTGTDGKTTTASLIYHILKIADRKTSMISTVYANIGGNLYETGLHTTTPNAYDVQKYLRLAVKNHDEFFVLETTSHAIDQNRVWGVDFAISVITNITHEHLDYHRTYNNYLKTKAKLLQSSNTPIVNADDKSYDQLKQLLPQKYYSYSRERKADFGLNQTIIKLNLSDFNESNYLAAYSVAKLLDIPEDKINQALKTFILPQGRLELVYNKDFKIIVDFAHTPNAINVLLKDIKNKISNKGRIIHVFGSAGLRDHTKRPLMGKTSGSYADIILLTEEDCRVEDPLKICKEMSQGLEGKKFNEVSPKQLNYSSNKVYSIIIDRLSAVNKAVAIAQKGDIVLLTGKGHEKSLCRGKKEYPWDEKKAVMEAIKKVYG